MRRLVSFGLVLLVLAAMWAAGWFALAAWAEGQISTVLAEIAERGVEVECSEREVVGFPFALKIACGETTIAEESSGSQAELRGLTGGASVFAPTTAQVDLASPARVEGPFLTAPANLQWRETEIDIGMGLSGPTSVSFEAENVAAELPLPDFAGAEVAAAEAEGTLAPSEDGGTEAALAFSGLSLAANGTALPPLDGTASAELSVPPRTLLAGNAARQAPLRARAIQVSLTSGAARLDAEGDLSVDAEGIMDGVLILRVFDPEALSEFIAALPSAGRPLGSAFMGGMLAFGRTANVDGRAATELKISIERGRARIGLLDFEVPRIPLS